MHRRKSSKEEDDNIVVFPKPPVVEVVDGGAKSAVNGTSGTDNLPISRTRAPSTPVRNGISGSPPSAGPYRTTFNAGPNGSTYPAPASASPFRTSFSTPSHLHASHSRARSISGGSFMPSAPSPLSSSFPSFAFDGSETPPPLPKSATTANFPRSVNGHSRSTSVLPSSATAPQLTNGGHARTHSFTPSSDAPNPSPSSSAPTPPNRRHSRLHSRNLSIYFPRPGSLPQTSIAEDGAQELEFNPDYQDVSLPSGVPMPSASPNVARMKLGEGFTFGGRPPPDAIPSSPSYGSNGSADSGTRASRRGHHHKHSLSHNFFSFLEPGAELHSQPAPTPVSPWTPSHSKSSMSMSASSSFETTKSPSSSTSIASLTESRSGLPLTQSSDIKPEAAIASLGSFMLGAWIWVAGQQVGALSCTGLGYWVVFDSFGVAVGKVLPAYLSKPSMQSPINRPYGNARLETVVLFAQAVYLMFSAVYVFKETVEHVLLSSGGGEGHHHHPGDEDVDRYGIDFPVVLTILAFFVMLANGVLFGAHRKLVNITGNHLPSLQAILSPTRSKYATYHSSDPPSQLTRTLMNPYSSAPILASLIVFLVPTLAPPSQHRALDLLLATAEAFTMFKLAYPACVALGGVLLQTSPPRGIPGNRMENFLRTMREIERHPQVLHLPPAHIWQLTPAEQDVHAQTVGAPASQSIIVTIELRVSQDLDDREVVKLTRWAWEKCVFALGMSPEKSRAAGKAGSGLGVTVGVVRG